MTLRPATLGENAGPALLWVVEDDPVSREWLGHCCEGWGFRLQVDACAAQARARLRASGDDDAPSVLMLDLRLPDGSGDELLADLRAAGVKAPAIAMSADLGSSDSEGVFHARLRKPLSADTLLSALESVGAAPPLWDDARGLRSAAGRESTLRALRELLATDLQSQRQRLRGLGEALVADTDAIDAELHRLVGAARLTGAAALAAAVDSVRACCAAGITQRFDTRAEWQRMMQVIDRCIADGVAAG
jgi:CheY-like chemotaxis protein